MTAKQRPSQVKLSNGRGTGMVSQVQVIRLHLDSLSSPIFVKRAVLQVVRRVL